MTAGSGSEAVDNGRELSTYDQGMCQKYVRDPCWQVPSLYGSAIDAWNGATDKHKGDRSPPEGAPTYYSGGQYGHAVLSVGGGRIRSTDCSSATQVNDTDVGWPERAWGYSFLGWTGDLNGITLPISGSQPAPDPEDDDVPKFFNATAKDRTVRNGDITSIPWDEKVNAGEDLLTGDLKGWKLPTNARYTVEADITFDPSASGTLLVRAAQYDTTRGEWAWQGRWQEFPATSGATPTARTFAGKLDSDAETFQVQVQAHGSDVKLTDCSIRGLYWVP